ncbi:tyrosine-type recombinase/integrase [Halosimplex sp. J119]
MSDANRRNTESDSNSRKRDPQSEKSRGKPPKSTRTEQHYDQSTGEILEEIRRHVDPTAGLKDWPPEQGVTRYLDDREDDLSTKTFEEYEEELEEFEEFCERKDISVLSELDKADLEEMEEWYKYEVPVQVDYYGPKTMRDFLYLMRNFIRFLERREAVRERLHIHLTPPELEDNEGVNEEILDAERARAILDHLSTYEYATNEHAVWVLFAAFGGRRGTIQSIDLSDCHFRGDGSQDSEKPYIDLDLEDEEKPYIELNHRPERNTRLKNAEKSEREVAIDPWVEEVLLDFIENNRKEIADDTGREPLLTTSHGRISKSTLSKYAYKWTRPCKVTGECPHGRIEEDCDAAINMDHASQCPSSKSPHQTRKGYITAESRAGVPDALLSERCDVSVPILEKHYKQLEENEKRKLRQDALEAVREESDYDGYAG